MKRFTKFLDKYYFIAFIIYYIYIAYNAIVYAKDLDYKAYCVLFVFALSTVYKDIRKDVKWVPFIILIIPFMLVLKYISVYAYDIWHQILIYDWNKNFVIDLNPIFKKIPLNNCSFARIIKTDWLTWYFRLVYNTGFIYCATIPIYRSALAKDIKKILQYTLSAHTLQLFLILPFYRIFKLQEVWYVLNEPDGLNRVFATAQAKASWVMHCFPSMHTSIAFAMFLIAIREKDKVFKIVWSIYCISVIYSTMYLEIHWALDVLSGLLLGYATVKLVDFILLNASKKLAVIKNKHYYKDNSRASA